MNALPRKSLKLKKFMPYADKILAKAKKERD